jgi:hypothetical protein
MMLVMWCISIIPACGMRWEYHKFEATLDYIITRPNLKNENK